MYTILRGLRTLCRCFVGILSPKYLLYLWVIQIISIVVWLRDRLESRCLSLVHWMIPTLSPSDGQRTESGGKLSHFAAIGYWHWTVARISAARGGRPQAPEGGHASWADGSHASLARDCHWKVMSLRERERESIQESGDMSFGEKSANTIQIRTVGSINDYY